MTSIPPLLSFSSLRIREASGRPASSPLSFADQSLESQHATVSFEERHHERAFLAALLEPQLAEFGELRLVGIDVNAAFSSGVVGYAPRQLLERDAETPLTLSELLVASAKLAGQGRGVVERLLERLGMSELGRSSPTQLCTLDQRLAGLAHALCTRPRLVVMEEPFVGLTAPAAHSLMDVLVAVSEKVRLLVVGGSEPQSAELAALFGTARLTLVASAQPTTPSALRVRVERGAAQLAAKLEERGRRVAVGSDERSLSVFDSLDVTEVLDAAQRAGVALLEVTAMHSSG